MAKVKYRIREFKPTANQTGGHSVYAEAVVDNIITNKELAKKVESRTGTMTLEGIASYVIGAVIALLVCALLGGCTVTRIVPVVEYRTDTLLRYSNTRDSIYVHDSIRVSEKGDTVRIERWHTRWRDRWHCDTLYISKTDSVPKPYPVEVVKEVAKSLTWWQQTRMHVGGIVIFLLIIFAVWKIYKTLHPRL